MQKPHLQKKNRGFTLVELMVVIAVMLIITSVQLFNYSQFNSVTITNNLAYDIALALRQAQSYGMAVRGVDTHLSNLDFDVPYGIHFDRSSLGQFVLFADVNESNSYDSDSSTENLQTYTIRAGGVVAGVTVYTNDMSVPDDDCAIEDIDILFKRPDPEPYVYCGGSSKSGVTVAITVQNSTQDFSRIIRLYPTGQISINNE